MFSMYVDPNKIDPKDISVKRNQMAKFMCYSKSIATWSFNGKQLPFNARVEGRVIYINKVQKSSSGLYECEGRNKHNEKFYARGKLKVASEYIPIA